MDNSKKAIGIFSIAAIVTIGAFVALSATASATIINVPSAGNETIQQAINNASAGDTILVNATAYAGTTETIDVNKSDIIIRSVNGRAVIDANGADNHVVNITDQTNVTLDGFTIRDAQGTTHSVAGIYMNNASECTISNNIVTNISTTGVLLNAYGIHLMSSNNNTFSSISVSNITTVEFWQVYGIYLTGSNNNNFKSSISISNIKAMINVDGITLIDSSNNNIFSSGPSISNITAWAFRGIWVFRNSNNNTFSSGPSISNITANQSFQGIRVSWSSNNNTFTEFTITEITHTKIVPFPTTPFSYGIFIDGRTEDCRNNVFSAGSIHNTCEPGIDYAVRLDTCAHNTINESEIMDNGHGFWLINSGNNTIKRNLIVNHTADYVSGAVLDSESDYNEIHENCFYYNGQDYQARDNGTGNDWTGNFWDDWDGISTPYLIEGAANNSDSNPLDECPMREKTEVIERVPAITPVGLIALVSLLSAIAAVAIVRKRR